MTASREKIIVAMSGGVDSSVAAAMLVERGYDVTGVFMCLGTAGGSEGSSKGCCTPQDAADARRVADVLGIDMFVLNLADAFEEIIEDFVSQYTLGRTPNPCILCNSRIKFGRLIERADSLGVRYVATGHHARIVRQDGRPLVARARAGAKDQSYALFAISGDILDRILLPIGEIDDKARVRTLALWLGLAVHDKPDSQEICFVEDDDYVSLLRSRAPQALRAGDIVDSAGRVLGRHEGYGRYTIGQRRHLGVAVGEPMYVTRIDPDSARVTIGPRSETFSRRLSARGANWHAEVEGGKEFDATVQVRYNHRGAPARVRITGRDAFDVEFDQPVSAVTPGQAAVVYAGCDMLGGGWIESTCGK